MGDFYEEVIKKKLDMRSELITVVLLPMIAVMYPLIVTTINLFRCLFYWTKEGISFIV